MNEERKLLRISLHQHRHHEWELWGPELSYVVRFNKYSLIKKCFNLEKFTFNLSNLFNIIIKQKLEFFFYPKNSCVEK